MKKSRMLLATLVAATLVPSFAFAQDHDRDQQRDDHGQVMEHRDDRGGPIRMDERHDAMDHRDMHHQWHHEWHRGDRLPPQYWDHRVDDWRAYHLSEPPRGYYWANVDGDYVLVQIGTGIVLQMGF